MSEDKEVKPLSAEEIATMRADHADCGAFDDEPCYGNRLLATIEAGRERADAAVELLREIVGKWGIRERIKADLVEALYLFDRCNDDDVITRASFLGRADKHRAELARLDGVLGKEPSRG